MSDDDNPPPFDCNTCRESKYAPEMIRCCVCTVLVGTCHGSTRNMHKLSSEQIQGYTIRQGLCVECRRVIKEVAHEDSWTPPDKK